MNNLLQILKKQSVPEGQSTQEHPLQEHNRESGLNFDPGRLEDLERLVIYLKENQSVFDPFQKSFLKGAGENVAFLTNKQTDTLFDLLRMVEENRYKQNDWEAIYDKRLC